MSCRSGTKNKLAWMDGCCRLAVRPSSNIPSPICRCRRMVRGVCEFHTAQCRMNICRLSVCPAPYLPARTATIRALDTKVLLNVMSSSTHHIYIHQSNRKCCRVSSLLLKLYRDAGCFNFLSINMLLLTLTFWGHRLNIGCVLQALFECMQTEIAQFNDPTWIDEAIRCAQRAMIS